MDAESEGVRGGMDASRALLRSDSGGTSTTDEEDAAMMMLGGDETLIQACREAEKET